MVDEGLFERAELAPPHDGDVFEDVVLDVLRQRCDGVFPACFFVEVAQEEVEMDVGVRGARVERGEDGFVGGIVGACGIDEFFRNAADVGRTDAVDAHDHLFVVEVALVVLSRFVVCFEDLEQYFCLREASARKFVLDEFEDFGAAVVDGVAAAEIAKQEVAQGAEFVGVELIL